MNDNENFERLIELLGECNSLASQLSLDVQEELSDLQDRVAIEWNTQLKKAKVKPNISC